jgi:methionyl-tRNA formyltransferase
MIVLLFTKDDRFSREAQALARAMISSERLRCVSGRVGDPLADGIHADPGDWVISFLSPWIIPARILDPAAVAVNFHPASRDYPGTGCYNFALYENAAEYGAICHFMAEKVDTGAIVEERRFSVLPADTVETLKLRTMVTMLGLYHDVLTRLLTRGSLEPNGLTWSRPPFTRRELEALTVVEPAMRPEEVRRRIRATTYPGKPGPHVMVGGERFVAPVPDREPVA